MISALRSLQKQDIEESCARLHSTFSGNYENRPLIEDSRAIGRVTREKDTIYVSFRGSVNSSREIGSCIDMRRVSLEGFHLPGNAHAGICLAFSKIEHSLVTHVQSLAGNSSELILLVEGYSRGSGLATLAAWYLSRVFPYKICVITYSSMRIFDKTAAEAYEKKIGRQNHLSFTCMEDWVPSLITPERLGFARVGEDLTFSANDSPSFQERVAKRQYTYLADQIVIAKMVKSVVPATAWEAHMPQTYQEAAPKFFELATAKFSAKL